MHGLHHIHNAIELAKYSPAVEPCRQNVSRCVTDVDGQLASRHKPHSRSKPRGPRAHRHHPPQSALSVARGGYVRSSSAILLQ